LNKDQIDQQDWWGAVCLPSNLKQERFIAVFSEDVVKIFGEALPHKSVRVASTGLRVPQINIPNGLFSSKGSLLQQLKAQNLLDMTPSHLRTNSAEGPYRRVTVSDVTPTREPAFAQCSGV
jgi:hypothetical protein